MTCKFLVILGLPFQPTHILLCFHQLDIRILENRRQLSYAGDSKSPRRSG